MEEQVQPQKLRRRKKQPTVKQIKAIQYINQGMSQRQAMLKAGYSNVTASTSSSRVLMKSKGVRDLLAGMAGELQDAGLHNKYMVDKFKEWLEAQKTTSGMRIKKNKDGSVEKLEAVTEADYQTQIAGYDRWKKIMDDQAPGNTGKVKRKITLEEFLDE